MCCCIRLIKKFRFWYKNLQKQINYHRKLYHFNNREDTLSTGPRATRHAVKVEADKWCRNAYLPTPELYVNKFGLKVWSIWRDGALKTGQRISDWCFNAVTFEWVEYMQTAWWIALVFSQLGEQMLWGETEHVFLSSCSQFFSLHLILY